MLSKSKTVMSHVFTIALILWVISLVFPTALFFKVWTGASLLITYVVIIRWGKWTGGQSNTLNNIMDGPLHTTYLMDDSGDECIVPRHW